MARFSPGSTWETSERMSLIWNESGQHQPQVPHIDVDTAGYQFGLMVSEMVGHLVSASQMPWPTECLYALGSRDVV